MKIRKDIIIYSFDKENNWIFDPIFDLQFRINSTGAEIVKFLMKEQKIEKLLKILEEKYHIPKKRIERDVMNFLTNLDKFHLTEESFKNFNYLYVNWHLTNSCNLKCRHCYVSAGETQYYNELSFQEKLLTVKKLISFSDFCFLF